MLPREVIPATAGVEHVQDGIVRPAIIRAGAAGASGRRQQGRDEVPFVFLAFSLDRRSMLSSN